MDEITLQVQRDERSGWLVASWDAPDRSGGLPRKEKTCAILQEQIIEAVAVHFEGEEAPRRIRLHFISDPILVPV